MNRILFVSVFSLCTTLGAAGPNPLAAAEPNAAAASAVSAPDADAVVAKVGDEEITFGQINSIMNSSAVVGVSVPALGTPQRQGVAIVLLDKIISANLLYLDALKHGTDKDPAYQRDVQGFEDGVIASIYRSKEVLADIQVTDAEIDAYAKKDTQSRAKLTDDVRQAIRAALRKQKLDAEASHLREKLRQGIEITIDKQQLSPEGDEGRDDATVLARVGDQVVTWGETKAPMLAESKRAAMSGGRIDPVEARTRILDEVIDTRIMAAKGRAAGLDQDPAYQARVAEYRKTHLINLYRSRLLHTMEPTDQQVTDYYNQNKGAIAMREERKIQMVVLKTEEEARALKKKIEAGEVTIFEAARDHSIDPKAKQTLGEMGWVAKGTGFPALDELTFSLKPDEIGGPVKSPAGWHLVKVEDVRAAQFQDPADPNTHRIARRNLIRDRLNKYVADLRLNTFKVEVYQDRLNDAFRTEAAWVAQLEQKAKAPDSLTEKRTEELMEQLKR